MVKCVKVQQGHNEVLANCVETEAVVQRKTYEYTEGSRPNPLYHRTNNETMGREICRLDIIFDADRADGKRVRITNEQHLVSGMTYRECTEGGTVKVKYMPNDPTECLVVFERGPVVFGTGGLTAPEIIFLLVAVVRHL
jgi:hypothetical protein